MIFLAHCHLLNLSSSLLELLATVLAITSRVSGHCTRRRIFFVSHRTRICVCLCWSRHRHSFVSFSICGVVIGSCLCHLFSFIRCRSLSLWPWWWVGSPSTWSCHRRVPACDHRCRHRPPSRHLQWSHPSLMSALFSLPLLRCNIMHPLLFFLTV